MGGIVGEIRTFLSSLLAHLCQWETNLSGRSAEQMHAARRQQVCHTATQGRHAE